MLLQDQFPAQIFHISFYHLELWGMASEVRCRKEVFFSVRKESGEKEGKNGRRNSEKSANESIKKELNNIHAQVSGIQCTDKHCLQCS